MMAESSPEWKKPSDVMKLRRRSSSGAVASKHFQAFPGGRSSRCSESSETKSHKRKNPFACSPVVSASECNAGETGVLDSCTATADTSLQRSQLDKICEYKKLCQDVFKRPVDLSKYEEPTEQSVKVPKCDEESAAASVDEEQPRGVKTFPLDWSLKTKVRYFSYTSFNWCTPLRGVDESRGVEEFVRRSPLHCLKELEEDESAKQLSFQRHTMYWTHPNVPWLQTFPRISRSVRSVGQTNVFFQNEDIAKALYNNWCDSMNSVYLMVRHGVCPYFYVCCYNMTLLFRSAGILRDEIHSVVTPTSRGFRSAIMEEGVEFTLPLYKCEMPSDDIPSQPAKDSVPSSDGADAVEEDEDEENIGDESASIWLQDLGLDQRRYRSVDPSKVRDQRDIFRQIDYRPESTVLVEGAANTQALINYLLNCNVCFATTGAQAGLPPTILAPVAFRGATLQSLKVRQGSVADQVMTSTGTGPRRQMYTVELSGPVLPHSVAGLSRLFAGTTGGNYTASFAVHDPTSPLNCVEQSSEKRTDEVLSPSSVIEDLAATLPELDTDYCDRAHLSKQGLRELVCCQGQYSWTCN